jgi:hypothetical protein
VFEEALTKVLARLDAARTKGLLGAYALIGGLAVSAWGVPRATQDIDFAVAIGTEDPHALATFIGGRYDSGGPDDPLRGVVRATVTVGSSSVPLQLVFLPSTFSDAIFQRVETLSIMNHRVPVVTWDMLVMLKLYAGGPQDMLDARQVLRVRQPHEEELRRISSLADRLGIREEWTALSAEHAKEQ